MVAKRSARRGGCIAGRCCLLCWCLNTARRRQLCGRWGRRTAAAPAPTAARFTLLRRRAERSTAVRDVFGERVRDARSRGFSIRTFRRRDARQIVGRVRHQTGFLDFGDASISGPSAATSTSPGRREAPYVEHGDGAAEAFQFDIAEQLEIGEPA